MPRAKWRTVSCADDGIRQHSSQGKAYEFVAGRAKGERFRVQYDEQRGAGWCAYATVTSNGDGTTDED